VRERLQVVVPVHQRRAQRHQVLGLLLHVDQPAAPASSREHSSTSATFEASVARWNIDSPQNTCPTSTPYSPPTSTSPSHTSTLWAWPSRWSWPYPSRIRAVIQVPSSRAAQPATTSSKAVSSVAVQPQRRSRWRSERDTTSSWGSRTARGSGEHQGTHASRPGSTATRPRRASERTDRSCAAASSTDGGHGKQPCR
jgi:hypothetical protein